MNPSDYEGSLEQAECACFDRIAAALDLTPGKDATVAIPNGLPDAAVFDIGSLGTGETSTFPASALYFRATLDLFNRDRSTVQRWIMRLVRDFPVNRWHHSDDPARADANVVHFRIAAEAGAVSRITPTTVQTSNSGEVPTWTCRVLMDVVFICDPDYRDGGDGTPGGGGGSSEGGGGGETGGGGTPPDIPDE